VENGLPAWLDGITDTGCIATKGSQIAVADRSGNLYLSEDFGRAWSRRDEGMAAPSGILIC
jgi:hypothetical protein